MCLERYPPKKPPPYPTNSKWIRIEITNRIEPELIGMNEITKIKNEVKLKQWVEMIQQRNESGLTVTDWCRQNGINLKTYYYRLKRVRQKVCIEIDQHDVYAVTSEPSARTLRATLPHVESHRHGI